MSSLQFPSVVVTGHVLREINPVPAGGECPSRPRRARAQSDLQLGGREEIPACQGALALSGVLRRLQLVEEKILQVKASPCTLPLPRSEGGAFHSPFSSDCPGWVPSLTVCALSPILGV